MCGIALVRTFSDSWLICLHQARPPEDMASPWSAHAMHQERDLVATRHGSVDVHCLQPDSAQHSMGGWDGWWVAIS